MRGSRIDEGEGAQEKSVLRGESKTRGVEKNAEANFAVQLGNYYRGKLRWEWRSIPTSGSRQQTAGGRSRSIGGACHNHATSRIEMWFGEWTRGPRRARSIPIY